MSLEKIEAREAQETKQLRSSLIDVLELEAECGRARAMHLTFFALPIDQVLAICATLRAAAYGADVGVPMADMIACIRRELAMRERVYPRQVAANRMKPAEAAQELRRMRAVLAHLQAQPEGSLL